MDTEDVVHVLRNVHGALRTGGHALDVHPIGLDFPVRAGSRGLGFVDASRFARIVVAMDALVDRAVADELFEDVRSLRRHVAERFDDPREALEHADGWVNLRLPAAVRRRLADARETPVEFVETIRYRLLRRVGGSP